MRLSDFRYDLPEELIAQQPPAERDGSRMMRLDRATGAVSHHRFLDLPDLLAGSELVVCNDTRVMPARMWGRRATGGRVELLVVRLVSPTSFAAMTRAARPLRPGQKLGLDRTAATVEVTAVPEPGRAVLGVLSGSALDLIHREGVMPLPPYIHRSPGEDVPADRERYQTIFARQEGSVAAPTAGLHFTPRVVERLKARGCDRCSITLHVGPGTFQPVRTEEIEEHRMQGEFYAIPGDTARRINEAKRQGRPVLAVGTTTVRCLESAARSTMRSPLPRRERSHRRSPACSAPEPMPDPEKSGQARGIEPSLIAPGPGYTELFLRPGSEFTVVDKLLTNFHLPDSSLILLVSAFAGRERILAAYREAVAQRYRFYSYGDCMLIE